jgi:1-deoxy-D-xylulose-5-phosphate reductoisomerase
VVHSFVQFIDGSILAQLSPPDMTFAIQHCLLYPERAPGVTPTTDFHQRFSLDFKPLDFNKYPCLELAYEALREGATAPAVFNAANEVAVQRFLAREIGYLDIPKLIEHSLRKIDLLRSPSLSQLFAIDAETREVAGAHEF